MSSSRREKVELISKQFSGGPFGTARIFGHGEVNLPRMIEALVEDIVPNPRQPRRRIDPRGLEELAASIERHGLLQPIIVRRREEDDRYELVAGERRWRAFQQLGRARIPSLLTMGDAEELALIENLQREDLHPLDEAAALLQLKESHGYTHEVLAKSVSRPRSVVTEMLQLNKLPVKLLQEARNHPVSRNALVQLSRIADPKQQAMAWGAIKQGASFRDVKQSRTSSGRSPATGVDRALSAGRNLLSQLQKVPRKDLAAQAAAGNGRTMLLELRKLIDDVLADMDRA
jgi:ParB family chromosome partitioning protein